MRVLVTGAAGFVGSWLSPLLAARHDAILAVRRAAPGAPSGALALEGDLDEERFLKKLAETSPDAVLHLAALTDPELSEREPHRAERMNAILPGRLARLVSGTCRRFVQVSTDLVFDGRRGRYSELDEPAPLSVYGRSKLEGERSARAVLGSRALVVRLALGYGPRAQRGSRPSFAERLVREVASGRAVRLFTNEIRTPLYVKDAAAALVRLVDLDGAPPLLHLGGPDRCSRYEMGLTALESFGLSSGLAHPVSLDEGLTRARRPKDASLDSAVAASLGLRPRGLRDGFSDMEREMKERGFMVGS